MDTKGRPLVERTWRLWEINIEKDDREPDRGRAEGEASREEERCKRRRRGVAERAEGNQPH